MLREAFLLLLIIIPGAWQGVTVATSAIAMLWEMCLPLLWLLMPGAWQGLTVTISTITILPEMCLLLLKPGAWWVIATGKAVSAIAMLREMFPLLLPLLLKPGAWQGITTAAHTLTATAIAMPQ